MGSLPCGPGGRRYPLQQFQYLHLDNRRLNIPVDRTDETWGAENNNHLESAKMKVEQEGRNFLYQIPDDEIENNTMLTDADQN